MSEKLLFVDDDPNILDAFSRQMRKYYQIETALSGEAGLKLLTEKGPFAVVVADMRMSPMDGIQFLTRACTIAPDTVRIMLTGNADQQTAIQAVNEGRIFRFLTKPCQPENLMEAVRAGVAQYRLIIAEAELLEKTLLGSVSVLIEILSLSEPVVFGHAQKVRDLVRELSEALEYHNRWELELAALLAPIGYLTLPTETVTKAYRGQALSEQEETVLTRVPEIGYNLLKKIPRMEAIAEIVLYQNKYYNGAGLPHSAHARAEIPYGARLLKVLSTLLALESQGTPRAFALRLMRTHQGCYDPVILDRITAHLCPSRSVVLSFEKPEATRMSRSKQQEVIEADGQEDDHYIAIDFKELLVGDRLYSDIKSPDGSLLLAADNLITESVLLRLQNHASLRGVVEPIYVMPVEEETLQGKAA